MKSVWKDPKYRDSLKNLLKKNKPVSDPNEFLKQSIERRASMEKLGSELNQITERWIKDGGLLAQ